MEIRGSIGGYEHEKTNEKNGKKDDPRIQTDVRPVLLPRMAEGTGNRGIWNGTRSDSGGSAHEGKWLLGVIT